MQQLRITRGIRERIGDTVVDGGQAGCSGMPDPSRLKGPHNYAGRIIATIFTCGIYSFWWEYDIMTEGNRHFEENWAWEDSLRHALGG